MSAVSPELEAREWYSRHPECKPILDAYVAHVYRLARYRLFSAKRYTTLKYPGLRDMTLLVMIACARSDDPLPIAVIEQHLRAGLRMAKTYIRPDIASNNLLRNIKDLGLLDCRDELCRPTDKAYAFAKVFMDFTRDYINYVMSNGLIKQVMEAWRRVEKEAEQEKKRR